MIRNNNGKDLSKIQTYDDYKNHHSEMIDENSSAYQRFLNWLSVESFGSPITAEEARNIWKRLSSEEKEHFTTERAEPTVFNTLGHTPGYNFTNKHIYLQSQFTPYPLNHYLPAYMDRGTRYKVDNSTGGIRYSHWTKNNIKNKMDVNRKKYEFGMWAHPNSSGQSINNRGGKEYGQKFQTKN